MASKEDCIIVGRCGNYVLRDEERCKNIYLYAPLDVRISTIMERYQLDEKGAHSLVRKMDKDRRDCDRRGIYDRGRLAVFRIYNQEEVIWNNI